MSVDEAKLVECILNQRTYENGAETSHLDNMYRKFCENAEMEDAEKLDMYAKSELQRILTVKEFFEWMPVPETYFKRFGKSATMSQAFRDHGNRAYIAEDYERALRGYNLAISFAKPGEPELGLAYEKRADLFLTLNQPDLAQRDINLAAVNAYPKKAAHKLIELQNRCVIVGNKKGHGLQNCNKPALNDARRYCNDKFFRLKNPHENIQNVEDFVEIDYRSECGRRVIVTRDVPAGTVMLVDSPYAFILKNLLNFDTEHCHACTMPILGGIPCQTCTFAWFCSDSCFAKAANGVHRNEHRYLPYLHCHPMAFRIITAARILFTVGAEQLFNIFITKDPLYFQPQPGTKRGFSEAGVYEINSYLPMFHLISHPPSKFVKDVSDAFKALLMTHLIEQTTNFFQKPKYQNVQDRNDFKDFISSLLLRHMRSFEFNAITLSKLDQKIFFDPNNNPTTETPQVTSGALENVKTIRYGAAVYPVLCLLNHSCDPNSVPVRSLRLAKTSVVALKNLKRGDEITISYTPIFTTQDTQERLQYLMERYNFYCTCDACNYNWSNAKRTNVFGESFCDRCHRYLLTGKCPGCEKREKEMPKFIKFLETESEKAEKMIECQQFKEAEEIVASCLEKCGDFSSCFGLYIDLQQLYKRVLVGLFNL